MCGSKRVVARVKDLVKEVARRCLKVRIRWVDGDSWFDRCFTCSFER